MQSSFEKAISVREKTVKKIEKADKDIGDFTISHLFAPLFAGHPEDTKVGQYLVDLKNYTLENLDIFKEGEEESTIYGHGLASRYVWAQPVYSIPGKCVHR